MTEINHKREIVVVSNERIIHGYLASSRMGKNTTDVSLIDLLSNPMKTQPHEKFFTNPQSNLLYLSDTQIQTIRNDNVEKRAQVFIPTSSILFAYESNRDVYQSNPKFKIQANMEHSNNQRVEIGIGEYTFEGNSTNIFGRYHKDNIDFIAITSGILSFAGDTNPELSDKDFYALNKCNINNIALLD